MKTTDTGVEAQESRREDGGHDWEKTDLISGYKTNYRCKGCGGKGIRLGVEWPPRLAKGVKVECERPLVEGAVTEVKAEPAKAGTPNQEKPRTPNGEWKVEQVAPGRIAASKTNPRKSFPPEKQAELMESIKAQGVIVPLIVRRMPKWELHGPDLVEKTWRITKDGKVVWAVGPAADGGAAGKANARTVAEMKFGELAGKGGEIRSKSKDQEQEFELVAGERRWRCATELRLGTVPVIVRELSDAEAEEVQIIENLQREDVLPLEEAEQFRRMIESGRYTAETLAGKIGKSRSHVFGRLKLCKLSPKVREAVAAGKIDPSAAGLIGTVADAKAQQELLKLATEGQWEGDAPLSFRDLAEEVKERQRNLSKAPWKWDDAGLVKAAGPCTTCPKRGGNIAGWEGSPNVCTDPGCYGLKEQAQWDRLEKECAERGVKLLPRKATRDWFQSGEPCDWNRKVVDPNAKVPGDKKKRTWMGLFEGVPTMEYLVRCFDDQGKAKDWVLWSKAQAKAVELKLIDKVPTARQGVSYEEQERKRKMRQEPYEAAAPVVEAQLVAALEKAGPTAAVLRAMLERRGSWQLREALKVCGYKSVEKLSAGQLTAALAMRDGANVVGYNGGWEEGFAGMCAAVKVDLEKPLKAVKEAQAAMREAEKEKSASAQPQGKKGKGKK